MIKYIGSKRRFCPHHADICSLPECTRWRPLLRNVRVATPQGSGRSQANDHASYAASCPLPVAAARDAIRTGRRPHCRAASYTPSPGYFTQTFCEQSRFFHPANGARIDSIRERIAGLELDDHLEAVALTSLMEAADRVDSTTGVQMAYLKQWAPRALKELDLQIPSLLAGPGEAPASTPPKRLRC